MMTFPSIFDIVQQLDFMRGYPAAYGVMIAALIILAATDWRLSLFALMSQYLLAALLFIDLLDPRLAVIKLLAGLFICLILYITARQVNWGRLPEDVTPEEAEEVHGRPPGGFGDLLPAIWPARLVLVAVIAGGVWFLGQQPAFALPLLPAHANLAVFALCGLGLLALVLAAEPLKAGIGLLTFMIGFELFYSGMEQSVAMFVFLVLANLILALAIAYLTQARHNYAF